MKPTYMYSMYYCTCTVHTVHVRMTRNQRLLLLLLLIYIFFLGGRGLIDILVLYKHLCANNCAMSYMYCTCIVQCTWKVHVLYSVHEKHCLQPEWQCVHVHVCTFNLRIWAGVQYTLQMYMMYTCKSYDLVQWMGYENNLVPSSMVI